MRFMLLQNYGPVESDCPPMPEWSPADIRAHIEFQHALNRELLDRGELVDAQGLAGPEQARRVVSDGTGAPVITDGPFPEAKELLAGHHRFHAVRGHLLEMAGDIPGAAAEFRAAAAGTANLRERHYLTLKAASLAASPAAGAG